jgi:hypothetical protein
MFGRVGVSGVGWVDLVDSGHFTLRGGLCRRHDMNSPRSTSGLRGAAQPPSVFICCLT